MRNFRWILVPVLTLVVTGAAYACDKDHAQGASATVEKASVSKASSSCGSHEAKAAVAGTAAAQAGCSAAAKAECKAKAAAMAAAHDCPFCNLVAELKSQKGKVSFSTMDGKEGITMVFAAVSKDDVVTAQAVANKAYTMINAPAHCAVSKAQMADKSCGDCKEGLDVLSHAAITIENNESGAMAVVKPGKPEEMQKLQAFFQVLINDVKAEG